MAVFGIDVSRWQGDFNFKKAKAEGVKYVILKAGGADEGLYQDRKFDTFYERVKAEGLGVGAYFFGHAFSTDESVAGAGKFISIIAGKQFDYPVYYDVEGKMINQDKTVLTDEIIAFCETMQKAGYYAGVYSSESFFNNNMEDDRLAPYAHWVAKYSTNTPKLKSGIKHGMWQYGGSTNYLRSNRIAGVVCDQNYAYINYPKIIKEAGLNGYTAEGTATIPAATPDSVPVKSVDEVAQEVIAGKWGNGAKRKTNLAVAGYDYNMVQAKVNELAAKDKKSNQEIAQEVIAGKWGSGDERREKLKAAGYNPSSIQKIVNKLMP